MGDVDLQTKEADDNLPIWYPRVLGHEGSGYVEQVGSAVKHVRPSDPVILSFNSCGKCYNCEDAHPAYCTQLFERNFVGKKGVYAEPGTPDFTIGGGFFGQSSFASKAIVKAGCVVNLADRNATEDELRTLAPLGCGIQTGAGAFTNIANVQPDQEVAVIGVGGVGQSAIMVRRLPSTSFCILPLSLPRRNHLG
jgi:Zn-dependent alcohol dehydrogenase